MLGGYTYRLARIDLSTKEVRYEAPKEEDLRKYVGARGLGVKYVFENGPQVEPFSPDNLLAIIHHERAPFRYPGQDVWKAGRGDQKPPYRDRHRQPHGGLDGGQAQVGGV